MTTAKYHNQQTTRLPFLTTFLLYGIAALTILLIVVMLCPFVEKIFMPLVGTESKLELLKFIGWGMSGIIAVLVVFGLLQRAAALDEQNNLTEKGHIHERFKAATEHLGSERVSVRIAAFSEFYRLAKIEPESEPDLQETIFYILCAHLRQTTRSKDYKKEEEYSNIEESEKIKPTVEMHDLLDVLFKPESKADFIFGGLSANLRGANLQGASLQEVDLKKAKLQMANLKEAKLKETNLKEARMWRAKLQGANLKEAALQGANLKEAELQGANLQGAKINKKTIMPDDWEDVVVKDENGKTGVLLMDDE